MHSRATRIWDGLGREGKGRDLKKERERVLLCEMMTKRGEVGVWVEVEKEWVRCGMGVAKVLFIRNFKQTGFGTRTSTT